MNNSESTIEFSIKPLPQIYGDEGVSRILEAFKEMNPDTERGQMGAGASGLIPELAMCLIAGASLVGVGFLNAMGEDIYKLLKSSIIKLVKIKPNKNLPSLPPNYKGEVYTHLIWWIYFKDTRILLELNLQNEKDVEEALNKLPEAVDKLTLKEGSNFIRLFWDGKSWK